MQVEYKRIWLIKKISYKKKDKPLDQTEDVLTQNHTSRNLQLQKKIPCSIGDVIKPEISASLYVLLNKIVHNKGILQENVQK